MRLLVFLALLGPLAWSILALAAAYPSVTETVYARGIYPRLQRVLATGSSLLPISLAECLIGIGAPVAIVCALRAVAAVRRGEGTWRRLAGRALLVLLAACGTAYSLFLASWGLLHARPRLASQLGFDSSAPSTEEVASLLEDLIKEASRLRESLPEDEHGVFRSPLAFPAMADHVERALEDLQRRERFLVAGRVLLRAPLASRLLSACELAGIYCPFTGEAHVNRDLPSCILSFSAAHEGAHAMGLAREDEANFAAWLACSRSREPELRYSAALCAFRYVAGALVQHDPERAKTLIGEATERVRRDLADLQSFWERVGTPIARVSALTNDLYLKSQGQPEGTASYSEVVRLLVAWRR